MKYILETQHPDKNITLEQAISSQYKMPVFVRHLG